MRAIVTCECCGHRQTAERPIGEPQVFHLVCHGCERSLRVEVTGGDLDRAAPPVAAERSPVQPASQAG